MNQLLDIFSKGIFVNVSKKLAKFSPSVFARYKLDCNYNLIVAVQASKDMANVTFETRSR